MNKLLTAVALAGALLMPAAASAQDYPSKAVKIIIPSGPGAANDTFARFLADKLTQKYDQPFVAENMPGAGGAIGFAAVAQSEPDGHTLVLYSSSFVTNAAAMTNLPFDSEKDILPVSKFADGQLVIVASKQSGIATVEDLARIGKERTIFIASTGPVSTPGFVGLLVGDVLGIQGELVNYKGGAEALVDVAGGRADIYVGTISTVRPVIERGDALPLAVLQAERADQMPDVPTIVDAGYPDAAASIWTGIYTTAGTPAAVVEQLNADIAEILQMEDTIEMLEVNGSSPSHMPVAEFQAFVTEEIARWRAIAEKFGISG